MFAAHHGVQLCSMSPAPAGGPQIEICAVSGHGDWDAQAGVAAGLETMFPCL
jgi:hypothetical protein